MVVDLVTSHDFNLYAELNHRLQTADKTLSDPPANVYAVACRGFTPRQRWIFQAWHNPLAIGQPLPTLPIWLRGDLAISLDLEASYERTCRALRIA